MIAYYYEEKWLRLNALRKMINAIVRNYNLAVEIIILQGVLYPLTVSEFEVSVKSFANIFYQGYIP